jgi:hypothetical protein
MMSPEWSVNKAGALDWGRHMRNIVDEAGEIIAKATDDHTLIGGHHLCVPKIRFCNIDGEGRQGQAVR